MPTKPAQITDPMWWFVEQCLALTPTASVDEYGGTYTDKSGSHNSRNRLIALGLSNDYSIRDPLNKQGPGDKGAAFDWTFPSAQAGNYTEIVKYSARIKAAYESKDPRTYPLFEVLCEADFDYDPEGYVFYPTRLVRTPDRTHKWHMHWGFIRKYLDDWQAFRDLFSLISGEPLSTWKARQSTATTSSAEGDDMGTLENLDEANWRGGTAMGPPVPDPFRVDKLPELPAAAAGQRYGNSHNDRLYATQKLVEQAVKDVAELKARPAVDAAALAAALAGNTGFVTAFAAAVAAQVNQQAGATADQVRKIVDEELDEQSLGGADKD